MDPVVSIIICTRNRASQLPRALDALAAMQCRTAWEVIILDNGSTDKTGAIVAEYATKDARFRPASETESGLGAARDTAWRLARGRILSFTDDDCYVAPDYADQVAEVFDSRPEIDFAGGRIMLHNPEDARVTIDERNQAEGVPERDFIATGALHGANLSFRREVLEAIGGFCRLMGAGTPFPCEDIDAVARAVWKGFRGGFDPRPSVRHDHGRKSADVPALMRGYDYGRAAYFARFLARPDTSAAYRRGIADHLSRMSGREAVSKGMLYMTHGNRFLARDGGNGMLRFNSAMLQILFASTMGKLRARM